MIQCPIYNHQLHQYKYTHIHNNIITTLHAFEYFNNAACPYIYLEHVEIINNNNDNKNNGNNSTVNCCCAPLTPNIQQIIDNPTTGDTNNIIALQNKSDNFSVKILRKY